MSITTSYEIEVDKVSREEWSDFLLNFDDAVIYQTWPYGFIRWGQNKMSHIVLRDGNQILAIAQCIIMKLPGISAGIAYIPWGPIYQLNGKNSDPVIFQQMISAIYQEYGNKRHLLVRIAPKEIANASSALHLILESEGFKVDPSFSPHKTFVIDLSFSLEKLRQGMKRQWRQNLKHAEKNNLEIIEGTSDDLYIEFLGIYEKMLERKVFETGVDVEQFRMIQKKTTNQQKMNVKICQYKAKPIAGLVVSHIGDTGIALHAATNEEGLRLRGAYLLQWKAIQWLKNRGARWYDLGGIDPETNPGGYQYKSGLSGKCGKEVVFIGHYFRSDSLASSIAVELGRRFKSINRKTIKKQ